ncbi:MAG: CHAT domain-containing protein [Saprospiraceae bacterium]|nr:CHAT domain-containing protein [Saprospiraceae bacterium]
MLGKEHPDYASSLHSLAILYSDKGDYTKAEPLFLEAKNIRAKVLGKEHPSYTTSLNNLAGIYLKKGDYTKAEPLYLEAKDIRAKVLGKEHPAYAWSLEYLATLYRDKGDYTKAEPLYLEAKGIMAKVLGKEHPNYAWGLYNLASLYSDKGDYTKAEPLFLEAKDIRVKVLGKEHPTYAWNLGDLSFLYQVTLRIPEARQTWLELNPLIQRLINQSATYSSENQMDAYVRTFDGHINKCFSFAQAHPSPEILRTAYDNALFFNGYLLENARSLARAYDHAGPAARDTFERWQGCLRRLAGEYTKPIAERRFVAETEAEAEVYEKALTRNLAAFGETRKQPHWNDVCDRLNADEAAVEFVRYPFFNPKRTDSVIYAAFILKPGWDSPRMVTLFEEKSIRFDGDAAQHSNELYAARGVKPLLQGNNKHTIDLYRLIWEPLQTHLKGTKKVYFATSGQLAQLNMGAIPIGKGKVLADRYTLAQLGSTRQLIKPRAFSTQNQTALLFGGIRYEADTAAIAQANTSLGHAIASRGLLDIADTDSTLKKDKWDYLPGTENEVNAIEKILLTGGLEPRTGRSYAATEEAFKAIGSAGQASPRVLHVATHGFFFPEVKDGQYDANEPVFKTSDNPLIRSGLILSGGNHAWQTGRPIRPGMEDGILTAYEISQMNLSNTELVVLSACETGLGDIQGNEGVYGLQRAFKIAGAKYLIMSLWQVPDRQTSLLMTAFYKKWLVEKLPVPEAFRAAQNELRDAGLDPYQWAGFVLVE